MTKIVSDYGDVTFTKDVDFCESEEGSDYVRIDYLYINLESRRQGHARNLLVQAVSQIKRDYPGLAVKIIAEPEEGIELSDLVSFYESVSGIDKVVY